MDRPKAEFYLGIILTLLQLVLPMNPFLKLGIWGFIALLCYDIILRSPWTSPWHSSIKIIVCIAIAGFVGWQAWLVWNPVVNAIKREETIGPVLSCEINQASHGPINENSTTVLIVGTVRNKGAPSTAENYSLKIVLKDGSEISGANMTIADRFEWIWPNRTKVIKGSHALYNKTVEPIPLNGMKVGYLRFDFRGTPYGKFEDGVKEYKLSLSDANGHRISCSTGHDESGVAPNNMADFPGADQ